MSKLLLSFESHTKHDRIPLLSLKESHLLLLHCQWLAAKKEKEKDRKLSNT